MGKADFKKINDRWCGEEEMNNRTNLDEFYSEAAQNQPSTGKKQKKKSVKKSDHKHDYEKVLIDYEDWNGLCIGRECRICGKLICDRTAICVHTPNDYFRQIEDDELLQIAEYMNLRIVKGGKFI